MLYFFCCIGVLNYLILKTLIKYSDKYSLYKKKSFRDIHQKDIPNNGGIAFFLSLLISGVYFYINYFSNNLFLPNYFFILYLGICTMFFIGFIDDIYDISFIIKFIFQFILSSLIVLFCDIYLESFYGVLNLYEINHVFLKIFSIVLIVFIINSYNLIDGVDGLAASYGAYILFIYSCIFYFNNNLFDLYFSLVSFIILFSFLILNKQPAKIFMGDSGSLIIGFIISYLTLKVCNLPIDSNKTINPIFILCVLAYPALDTLRVFFIRISKGISPFMPDNNHLHHLMLNNNFSHFLISFFTILYSLILIFICYFLRFNHFLSFFIMVFIALFIVGIFIYMINKNQNE